MPRGDYLLFSVRFLSIKTNKLKCYKISKIKLNQNRNRFQLTGFGLVILFKKPKPNQIDRFRFSFGSVKLFYIKNQKLYCFLGVFRLSNGF